MVVEVVVDVGVVVVVVVVADWQTEMFTVLPLATEALAAGFWLSTLPGLGPTGTGGVVRRVGHEAGGADRRLGRAGRLADHGGHRGATAARDHEVHRACWAGRWRRWPGSATTPDPWVYWLEHALLWDPTLRPAPRRVRTRRRRRLPEHARHRHRRLRARHRQLTTGTFALTLVPPAGLWSSTVPDGLGARHVLDLVGEPGILNQLSRRGELLPLDRRHGDGRDVRSVADHQVDRGVLRHRCAGGGIGGQHDAPGLACWCGRWRCPPSGCRSSASGWRRSACRPTTFGTVTLLPSTERSRKKAMMASATSRTIEQDDRGAASASGAPCPRGPAGGGRPSVGTAMVRPVDDGDGLGGPDGGHHGGDPGIARLHRAGPRRSGGDPPGAPRPTGSGRRGPWPSPS